MNSYLICDNELVVSFYANGVPIAHYDKATKNFQNVDKGGRLSDAQKTFFSASLMLEVNKPKEEKTDKKCCGKCNCHESKNH